MNSVDTSRRNILKAGTAGALVMTTGGILLPNRAQAFDPATVLVLLGTIIGAAFQYKAAKESSSIAADAQLKAAEIQLAIEKMKQEYSFRMMRYQLGDSGVYQQTAVDRSGYLAEQGWSNNIDNAGGYVGLSKGQVATERGHYKGTINTAEADRFASGVARGYPMPVPVENGYHPYSANESKKLHALFDSSIGSDAKFIGGRHYSSARSPTESGWDLETVMYANTNDKGRVNAVLVPRETMLA